jgi:hypothetical protein
MPLSTCWSPVHPSFSALIVCEHIFSVALLSGGSAVRSVSTLSLDSEVLVGPRDWDPKAGSGTEKETRALGLREYPHRSHPTHAVRGDCVFTNIGILLWPWRA